MKVIIEDDNGTNLQTVENVVSYKIWTLQDFADKCSDMGIEPTKWLINEAAKSAGCYLNECLDEEWCTIETAIENCHCNIKDIYENIYDFAYYDEDIAKFAIEGHHYPLYSIKREGTDIQAMLEETLHRIISLAPEEKTDELLYAIMGAEKTPDDLSEDECWTDIDLGYGIRGHILAWDIM